MARPPRDRRPRKGKGKEKGPDAGQLEDRPPFLSWRGIYCLVLGALALQVVLYALLSRVMS